MSNIGHAGSVLVITSDVTFGGTPFTVTYFPDDTDPFAADDIEIGDAVIGTNGNLASWAKATIQPFNIAVLPNTADHKNLLALLNANIVAPGKVPNNDTIKISRVMPSGTTMEIKECIIKTGSTAMTQTSGGRIKTPVFGFVGVPATEAIV